MMELVDIYDDNGCPTGEVLDKVKALARNKWHRVVVAWIVNSKGEVLLQQRSATKRLRPGMWDVSASGHIPAGESDADAIRREMREELGVEVTADDLVQVGSGAVLRPYLVAGFVVKSDLPVSAFTFKDHEVAAVKWMPISELAKMGEEGMIANNIVHLAPWNYLFDYVEFHKV